MTYPHTFRTEHTECITTSSIYGSFYARQKLGHIPIAKELVPLLHDIDDSNEEFIENLREFVSVENVIGEFEKRHEMNKMLDIVETWLKRLKIKYECFDVGWYEMALACCKMPNVILGETVGGDRRKKTVSLLKNLHFKITYSSSSNINTIITTSNVIEAETCIVNISEI